MIKSYYIIEFRGSTGDENYFRPLSILFDRFSKKRYNLLLMGLLVDLALALPSEYSLVLIAVILLYC